MMLSLPSPLGGPPPNEIPLPKAPLERVIAQVRFPPILKIEDKAFVASFQEAIRTDYPLLKEVVNQTIRVEMTEGQPNVMPITNKLWNFASSDNIWLIALADDALTIEVSSYVSRAELLRRWAAILAAAESSLKPGPVLRIGVRFINRICSGNYAEIDSLIKPNVLGGMSAMLREHLRYSFDEALFEVEEGDLRLRWGALPPMSTPDPGAIRQIAEPSFVLDIDVSSSKARPFVTSDLSSSFRELAERAYSVFRFAITDQFLVVYGAHV